MEEMITKISTGCATALALVIVYIVFFAWIFSLIWNWVVPDVFGLPEINYLQAFGIMVLARIIWPNVSVNNKK